MEERACTCPMCLSLILTNRRPRWETKPFSFLFCFSYNNSDLRGAFSALLKCRCHEAGDAFVPEFNMSSGKLQKFGMTRIEKAISFELNMYTGNRTSVPFGWHFVHVAASGRGKGESIFTSARRKEGLFKSLKFLLHPEVKIHISPFSFTLPLNY